MPAIFLPQIAKKINKACLARVIVICSDHRHVYGGPPIKVLICTSTSPESTLHKFVTVIVKGPTATLFLTYSS